jgi:hypothetical protein
LLHDFSIIEKVDVEGGDDLCYSFYIFLYVSSSSAAEENVTLILAHNTSTMKEPFNKT